MGRRRSRRESEKTTREQAQPSEAASQAAAPKSWARRHGHWIALAVTIAVVLFSRIGMFTSVYAERPTIIRYPDSATYEEPARAILQTGHFAVNPESPNTPMIVRTPGYPLFIAANYRLFGIDLRPVLINQILLGALAIVVVFLLCLRLRGPRAAVIAAILMALEPITYYYAPALLSDALFMVMVALIAAAGGRLIQAGETEMRWAWLLGLAIAVSAYLRPISYFLIVPAVAGMVMVKRMQGRPTRRLVMLGAALAAPWVALVGGWQLRNAVVAGTTEFSAIQSVNLFQYRAAGVVALRDHITLEGAQRNMLAALGEQAKLPQPEIYKVYRREALKILRAHPWLTIRTMIDGLDKLLFTQADAGVKSYMGQGIEVNIYKYWGLMTASEFYEVWIHRHFSWLLINVLMLWPASALLFVGLAFAPWRKRGEIARETVFIHLFLVGLLLYLALLSAGPEANLRFRLPMIPVLALYSGIGWDKAARGVGNAWREWRRLWNAGRR